jgi:hypothetical protein
VVRVPLFTQRYTYQEDATNKVTKDEYTIWNAPENKA